MQNRHLLSAGLIMLLMVSGCGTTSKQGDLSQAHPLGNPSEMIPAQDVVKLYKNSIETLFAKASETTSLRASDTQAILALKPLFEAMIWGEIGRDRAVIALSSGTLGKSIFAILTPDNPELKIPGATLQTSHNPKYNSVVIRPHPISNKWAGAFLVHELSHIRELNKGHNFSRGRTEFNAYRLEMQALNILTDGHYYNGLDTILNRLQIASIEEFVKFIKTKDDQRMARTLLHLHEMTALITEWPASPQELEMRHGVNTMALLIRFYENKGLLRRLPAIQIHKVVEDVISAVSMY